MMKAARLIFSFFWFAGRKARRTRVLLLVAGLPVLAAAVIRIQRLVHPGFGPDVLRVFSDILMVFYLQFLIMVLALFFGTSVVSEEVENKTLVYLTTRPVSKPAVLAGKFAAYAAFAALMTAAGAVLSFLILGIDALGTAEAWLVLLRSLAVLLLGVLAYSAFFTLLGTFLKKSVLFGLFFCFGWESVVQYFPGSTQNLTLMHYLKSILRPETVESGKGMLSFLFFRLEPSPVLTSVLTLLVFTAAALVLAALVFSRREYLFEE